MVQIFEDVAFVKESDYIHTKKILHYLLSGRVSLHKESIRKWLSTGDDFSTSKKDAEIRHKELFTNFADKVISKYFVDDNSESENKFEQLENKLQPYLSNENKDNKSSIFLSDLTVGLIKIFKLKLSA